MTLWKPVIGHEGRFEVSNQGDVRCLPTVVVDRLGRTSKRPGHTLKVFKKDTKHRHVRIAGKTKTNYYSARVLVAKTFLEEPAPGNTVVRFKDGDLSNCASDNLFWDVSLKTGGSDKAKEKALLKEEQKPADFSFMPEPWTEKALCRGRPLGVHDTSNLPPSNSNAHRRYARKLCEGCPVLGDCADYAVRTKATGVVMAGVPIKSHSNIHIYEELRAIAGQHKRTQK